MLNNSQEKRNWSLFGFSEPYRTIFWRQSVLSGRFFCFKHCSSSFVEQKREGTVITSLLNITAAIYNQNDIIKRHV
jgi:hypothetical protein